MKATAPAFRAFKRFRVAGYSVLDAWRWGRLCSGQRLYIAPQDGVWTIFRDDEPLVNSLDACALLGTMLKIDREQCT